MFYSTWIESLTKCFDANFDLRDKVREDTVPALNQSMSCYNKLSAEDGHSQILLASFFQVSEESTMNNTGTPSQVVSFR